MNVAMVMVVGVMRQQNELWGGGGVCHAKRAGSTS